MLPATNQLTGERSEPKSWGRIGAVNVVLNRCFGGHVAPTWRAARGRQQGAPARMPTRITVRYLGSEVGKKVARPDTKGELLELAAKRLNLSTPASRIFAEGGDEYDGDEDVVLIESDEIIYVSCGEDFGSTAPTGAPSAPPAAAAPAPTPPTAPQPAVLPQQAVSETSTPAVEVYAAEAVHLHSAGPGAATNNLDGDGVLLNRRQTAAFTAECGTRVATW